MIAKEYSFIIKSQVPFDMRALPSEAEKSHRKTVFSWLISPLVLTDS